MTHHYRESNFPHIPERAVVVFLGSSVTQTDYSGSSWRKQVEAWLVANAPTWLSYAFWNNAANDGSWLIASQLDVKCLNYRPALTVLDCVLDSTSDTDKVSPEALVRRYWRRDHAARLIFIAFPTLANLNDSSIVSPLNSAQLANVRAICAAYGAAFCDVAAALLNQVQNFGHHLTEYYTDVSTLNAAGHNLAFNMLQPLLAGSGRIAGLPRFDKWLTLDPCSQYQLSWGSGGLDLIPTTWSQLFVSARLVQWHPAAA